MYNVLSYIGQLQTSHSMYSTGVGYLSPGQLAHILRSLSIDTL